MRKIGILLGLLAVFAFVSCTNKTKADDAQKNAEQQEDPDPAADPLPLGFREHLFGSDRLAFPGGFPGSIARVGTAGITALSAKALPDFLTCIRKRAFSSSGRRGS